MAQENKKLISHLNDLITLDHDAVGAYKASINRIDVPFLKERLREFQSDHVRHIQTLSDVVRRYGGTPKERPDMKGFMLKGFTAVTSAMGNEAALRAMQGNEMLTNRMYKKALDEQWPEDIRAIIASNYADEQRHLAFIENALKSRSWEEHPPAP